MCSRWSSASSRLLSLFGIEGGDISADIRSRTLVLRESGSSGRVTIARARCRYAATISFSTTCGAGELSSMLWRGWLEIAS